MGRACLVRSLKGLKGFSTRQVVPVLFPTPKRLRHFTAPSCQMAIARLGTRSWRWDRGSRASSGRGLHRALALGLGPLGRSDWCSRDGECWAGRSHVSPPAVGGRGRRGGRSSTLSPSSTSLLLRFKLGGQTTVLILFDPNSPPSSFSAERVIPSCTLRFGEHNTYPPLSKPAAEASCPVALAVSLRRSWRERSHGTASSRSPPRSAGSAPCETASGSRKPPSRRFRGSDHTASNEKVDDLC